MRVFAASRTSRSDNPSAAAQAPGLQKQPWRSWTPAAAATLATSAGDTQLPAPSRTLKAATVESVSRP